MNKDKVPVTGAMLSLIVAIQAAQTLYLNESSMAKALGRPQPKSWHERCESLFSSYSEEAKQIGLSLNAITFKAILNTELPAELTSCNFEDLPKRFVFDPWLWQGKGGIVEVSANEPVQAGGAGNSEDASLDVTPITTAACFGDPFKLYDHSHITTPAHAALFKTGELELPGWPVEYVAVKFNSFQFNTFQKRDDAVFEVTRKGTFIGTYFASAFKGLCL